MVWTHFVLLAPFSYGLQSYGLTTPHHGHREETMHSYCMSLLNPVVQGMTAGGDPQCTLHSSWNWDWYWEGVLLLLAKAENLQLVKELSTSLKEYIRLDTAHGEYVFIVIKSILKIMQFYWKYLCKVFSVHFVYCLCSSVFYVTHWNFPWDRNVVFFFPEWICTKMSECRIEVWVGVFSLFWF